MKYIVLDLEMCSVPRNVRLSQSVKLSREIIQIGAAVINEKLNLEEKTFQTFVRPNYGYLDRAVKSLTGIKNSDLDNAPDISEALQNLEKWLPRDDNINFVTWSENDMYQLRCETSYKNIKMSILHNHFNAYLDCQAIFSKKIGANKKYCLSEALNISSVDYEDKFHNAMVDATNTAILFIKTQKEDTMRLSPYYIH